MEEGEDKQLVLSLFLLLIGTTIPPSAKKGSNFRNRTLINHNLDYKQNSFTFYTFFCCLTFKGP